MDQIQLIFNLLDEVNVVLTGGVISSTFVEEVAVEIGSSLYDKEATKTPVSGTRGGTNILYNIQLTMNLLDGVNIINMVRGMAFALLSLLMSSTS